MKRHGTGNVQKSVRNRLLIEHLVVVVVHNVEVLYFLPSAARLLLGEPADGAQAVAVVVVVVRRRFLRGKTK